MTFPFLSRSFTLSSSLFSSSTRRYIHSSLINMAPQHHKVAVIGSGPAGKFEKKLFIVRDNTCHLSY
jgi:hypothetical protein